MRILPCLFGDSNCTNSAREFYVMSTKKVNNEGLRKVASGMKKTTTKYGLVTKSKDTKKSK